MRRIFVFLLAVSAFTNIGCPPTPKVDPTKDTNKSVEKPVAPIETPDQLKVRIEAALEQVRSRDLLTTHAFWTVFHGILGSGPDKTMLTNPKTKEKVSAIDYICNGNEIRGLQFLPTAHGLDVRTARPFPQDPMGELQGHQDQFIAEMAQWNMPRDRKFKVGGRDYTFEDFIRHSKMRASTTKDQELSWAIVIIGQFYGTDHAWTNGAGEKLRFEDVVKYEVDASTSEAACGGTHRLFGLTWAYHLHLKNGGKKEGVWKEVEAKIETYKKLAKNLQNPDRSMSTDYFKGAGNNPDRETRIGTTGHTVEWLALAMTDDELKAPWMQDAVNTLALMILDMDRSPVESGALYHAAHGLHLYHERRFGTPPAYLPLLPKK